MTECQIDKIQQTLINQFSLEWLKYLDNKPKLRTYCLFKRTFCTENYVMNTISRSRRSLFTQLRLGILPLEIEAGRFTPMYDKSIKKNRKRHPSERLCKLCNMKICEDEIHFMLICPMYEHARQYLIKHVLKIYPCFNSLSSIEKLKLLMQHYQFQSLTYIKQAWDIRQQNLHSCY